MEATPGPDTQSMMKTHTDLPACLLASPPAHLASILPAPPVPPSSSPECTEHRSNPLPEPA